MFTFVFITSRYDPHYRLVMLCLIDYTIGVRLGILVVTSVERFTGVTYPLHHRTHVTKGRIIYAIVVTCLLWCIPPLVYGIAGASAEGKLLRGVNLNFFSFFVHFLTSFNLENKVQILAKYNNFFFKRLRISWGKKKIGLIN